MTRILHISADYPDAIQPVKTRAIAALVEGTQARFDHLVYSVNRLSGLRAWLHPGSMEVSSESEGIRSCRLWAPARGFRLARAMSRLAAEIEADLQRRSETVDLVHGHKLTIEGLAARELAGRLGVPYLLTVQGNSDQKVMRARPDLTGRWRCAWRDAAEILSFAPWATSWVERRLGERSNRAVDLPCVPVSDAIIAPIAAPALVRTAFNLADWRNKNVAALAAATAIVRKSVPGLSLEIAGGGPPEAVGEVDSILSRAGVGDIARRVGPVAPGEIQQWMNSAALFALPSRRESFGMVFAEALLAGCPIIHPRGAAVDGYFGCEPFAQAVRANDPAELADRMIELLRNQQSVKAALARWQRSPGASFFRRAQILDRYSEIVVRALG